MKDIAKEKALAKLDEVWLKPFLIFIRNLQLKLEAIQRAIFLEVFFL
ncbi:hypothetical protein [uncultured Flavobacterium sp.]|nr:hypothetical protein [uncultured Flavobacterium sp.]